MENNLPENELVVSGDGTWLKRGFSSSIGVCTVIGKYTGKVLDYFVSFKTCKACEIMEKKLNRVDFDIWYESEHQEESSANYQGSSGGMEFHRIIEIFKNSLKIHMAKYAYYIGETETQRLLPIYVKLNRMEILSSKNLSVFCTWENECSGT